MNMICMICMSLGEGGGGVKTFGYHAVRHLCLMLAVKAPVLEEGRDEYSLCFKCFRWILSAERCIQKGNIKALVSLSEGNLQVTNDFPSHKLL